ncbi:MAG TPA: penicillin-insensitive murein endopeptidase [Stellaceae bacterium]|nr:penicillin-insensitive murein endopeptidase [Stellaceae bacterium]
MWLRLAVVLLLIAPAGLAWGDDGNPWSRAGGPATGAAEAIGSPAKGCLEGAVMLPPDGLGYQVIRLSRRRNFGLPETVDYVRRLGAAASAAGLAPLYIGDMAQPRGGPLPFGHASHQTGLDVDIWFTLEPKPVLASTAREDVALPSMLLPNWRSVDPRHFGAAQVTLLRLAAADSRVDRIFVNPVIKATLCRRVPASDHAWLRKLRPWFGHDDHFHVRLTCPSDSPECEPQAPVPPGDGCDATLSSWVRDQRPPLVAASAPSPHRAMPVLPQQCRAVLAMPPATGFARATSLP